MSAAWKDGEGGQLQAWRSWGERQTEAYDKRQPGYAQRMERAKVVLHRERTRRRRHVQDVWAVLGWLAGACQ